MTGAGVLAAPALLRAQAAGGAASIKFGLLEDRSGNFAIFGLGFVDGVAAILLGNIIGCALLALTASMGPEIGMPQLPFTRHSFGTRGAYLPALLNWVSSRCQPYLTSWCPAAWKMCVDLTSATQRLLSPGEPVRDDSFMFCMNPHHENIRFYLPKASERTSWELVVDTRGPVAPTRMQPGQPYDMVDHSAALFREVNAGGTEVK